MAEQAVEDAQNYTWEKITARILDLYENILNSRNR
jgi:glycosyltransferase involved in cell wall biosynthesis